MSLWFQRLTCAVNKAIRLLVATDERDQITGRGDHTLRRMLECFDLGRSSQGGTDCDATLALAPVSTSGESFFFASLDCDSIMHFTMLRV